MNQEDLENQSISRLSAKKQSLDDMYSVPANFLEIDVINPQTTIQAGKKKFTDYEIRMRVSCSRKFLGNFSLRSLFLFRTSYQRCVVYQQRPYAAHRPVFVYWISVLRSDNGICLIQFKPGEIV